ncbi:hypothetical protein PARHAE_03328 [Paracoccus haematequi]|uniref:Uncharacterized protein n=1 Tax=Paracoccus haematequi TaxID=2491866 RepID=A0A3S4CL88_9RHOB|nr:hypothetical protein [Paracoccus haematequi]VDS10116.1 hypothetical protein PARHAE_03328 [Paracoccus haematequi]
MSGFSTVRASDLLDDIAMTFDLVEGAAELINPILEATCDNPCQRRMLETLAASLEAFARAGRSLVRKIEELK